MKIAVMGAGGLGGYIGGRLALAGRDVRLIARGTHLKAIQQNGLHGKDMQGEFRVQPAQATDDPREVGQVDLILFSVKSYDTESAAQAMDPLVGPHTAVIPVLNGIQHIEQLRQLVGTDHILGGVSNITAHIAEPGIVERVGSFGVFEFGEMQGNLSPRCQRIQKALDVEGISGTLVPNIEERMWWKFAGICGFGLFSVVRGNKEMVLRSPEAVELLWQTIGEVVAVARAKNISLDNSLIDEVKELFKGLPSHIKPSMLVDLERGRRIEVAALNGTVSQLGKELGVPTPTNDFIYACLKPHIYGEHQYTTG